MLQVKGLLEGQEYNSIVSLNMECRTDLQWWIDQLSIWNGRSLISSAPDLIITTDASLKGWGAVCQGVHTRGLWTQEESLLHINALELKAALFALRAFSKSRRKLHVVGTVILTINSRIDSISLITQLFYSIVTLSLLGKQLAPQVLFSYPIIL